MSGARRFLERIISPNTNSAQKVHAMSQLRKEGSEAVTACVDALVGYVERNPQLEVRFGIAMLVSDAMKEKALPGLTRLKKVETHQRSRDGIDALIRFVKEWHGQKTTTLSQTTV